MPSAHTELSAIVQDIRSEFQQLKLSRSYIGFSGGVDSTLLLWCAVEILGADNVTALHINHGLSPNAARWQQHCADVTAQLGCQFIAMNGQVEKQGQGIEAAARSLRYSCFEQQLPNNATLLLGHHLDDQVETFFLRLFRGAGLHGLKSMQKLAQRTGYQLYRPLLDLPRHQIESLATDLSLSWIEDESNADEQFDRNFLRQSMLPLVESRWPAYRERVRSTIELLAQAPVVEQKDMSQELAHRVSHDGGLKLVQLGDFDDAQLLSLLHGWLNSIGQQVPSKSRLQAIVDDVINARPDAAPLVSLGEGHVRRHGPALYWVANLDKPGSAPPLQLQQITQWQGVGEVSVVSSEESPVLRADLPELHWRLRQGGESMRPHGRSKRRDLKRLLQEYRIKPWLRDSIPLLFSADTLVAVGDELISEDHLAQQGQSGLKVIWRKA